MAIFYQYRPYPTGIAIGYGKNGKEHKVLFEKNYLKDINSTWAIATLPASHSPSVNSFFNIFLLFFCFLLYLWHYFSCNTDVNWETGMEWWFGYWILVTIKFCELSFKFRPLLLFIWEATSNTSQNGRELEPNCILHLFLGLLMDLCQSSIGQFFCH